ncbi:hypothetical protein OIU78_002329 [Salix suchowensis]|nr:hypothetical protein OIU78_002329 [Salix suchowensis]
MQCLTLDTSNLGRRFMTCFKSEPLTRASRSRKVMVGVILEGVELRISGHMEMIRRNSRGVKFLEVSKPTMDLMFVKEAERMIGRWLLTRENMSRPNESR